MLRNAMQSSNRRAGLLQLNACAAGSQRANERSGRAQQEPAVRVGVDRHVGADGVAHGEDSSRVDHRIVADLDLETRVALTDPFEGLRRGILRRWPLHRAVRRRRFGAVAAEELPQRNACQSSSEIPARHVDAGLCVRVTGQGVMHRPGNGLRRARIEADHARPENVESRPLPTGKRRVVGDADRAGFTEPDGAVVGDETNDQRVHAGGDPVARHPVRAFGMWQMQHPRGDPFDRSCTHRRRPYLYHSARIAARSDRNRGWHIGLHLSNFTWPGGPATMASDLGRAAKLAEDVGFTKLSVMDHVWQIGIIGPPENDMLEAYTALGYIAAKTERIQLLAWVTAAIYRQPGLLAKEVTTLDVLSQGRAWLGIGAAWNEEESVGLGLAVPFHRRALRAARGNAADLPADVERQRGAVRRASTTRWGARSTHRSRCNDRTRRSSSAAGASARRCGWWRSTRRHATCSPARSSNASSTSCASTASELGRNYDDIEKTVMTPLDPGDKGENVDAILTQLQGLAALGITHLHTGMKDASSPADFEVFGDKIIPEAAKFVMRRASFQKLTERGAGTT